MLPEDCRERQGDFHNAILKAGMEIVASLQIKIRVKANDVLNCIVIDIPGLTVAGGKVNKLPQKILEDTIKEYRTRVLHPIICSPVKCVKSNSVDGIWGSIKETSASIESTAVRGCIVALTHIDEVNLVAISCL